MVKKHPKTLKIFHLIGPGFITTIVFFVILTIFKVIPIWVVPFLSLLYVLLGIISSLWVTTNPVLVVVNTC